MRDVEEVEVAEEIISGFWPDWPAGAQLEVGVLAEALRAVEEPEEVDWEVEELVEVDSVEVELVEVEEERVSVLKHSEFSKKI